MNNHTIINHLIQNSNNLLVEIRFYKNWIKEQKEIEKMNWIDKIILRHAENKLNELLSSYERNKND